MSAVTVAAMLATNEIARRYDDEALTIFGVSGVTVLIMTIGTFVIRGVEKIAEANIMKSEFISIISHQLCTPLSSVRWNLEVLETEGSESLSEKQKKFLDNVKKSNEKMLKLVSDLLEVVRIDQGRSVFKIEMVELEPLAREVIVELEHLVKSKNIQVIERYDPNLPRTPGDAKKIKIVMENIISNAVKYSRDNGKVVVSLGTKGKKIIFVVQDWGVGIPGYQHGKVFEKFFRSNNESKYRTEGVGLGLYLVKAILRHFGGEVWFESEAGKGSTFYVSFPAA